MGKFNRNGGSFSRGSGSGKPRMYSAICDECGNSCELPFKPTGNKPVYCSDCFDRQGGTGGKSKKFGGKRRERPRFEDRPMYDAVCDKCGRNCQVPFKPTPGKEIFCDSCFGKDKSKAKGKGADLGSIVEQIKALNNKIDTLTKLLSPKASVKESKKEEVKEIKEVKKEEKTKKTAKTKKAKPAAKKKASKKK